MTRKEWLVVTFLAAGSTALGLVPSRAELMGRDTKYFPAKEVEAAFAKGMPILEQENYKIHASRREAPGLVEIHDRDTDIIHVLQGSATFVTGGEIVDGKNIAPDEVRGSGVRGGTTTQLVPGDVMVVPAGVPHWFKEVQGPFLYYVVKVQKAA